MTEHYQPVADLLQRVRTRWRQLVLLRALVRAALAAAMVLGGVLLVAQALPRAPMALALVGGSGVVLTALALVWGLWPARDVPSDARLARFVEERCSGLDQRLVSAVDVATVRDDETRPVFASALLHDAARAASSVDPSEVVPAVALRRAGFQALAAVLICSAVIFLGRGVARQAVDASSLALFPAHVVLEVTPGDARVEAGTALRVEARLVGNQAPVVAQLLRAAQPAAQDAQGDWQAVDMETGDAGQFFLSLGALTSSFRYRVVAGAATSSTFTVSVVRAPRVARIDVDYTYPKGLGLVPRTEQDGGDIYAPAGTDVRLRVHTDTAAATGRIVLTDSTALDLVADAGGRTMSASLKVTNDKSYRVTLADAEGLTSRGETEYFIRTMDDRPPEVHVVKPASDRRVTPLEEVDIEAEATDDFGVTSLALVYSVRGGQETVVPLRVPPHQTTVSAEHTLFLEDLDVRPGDFVSYYLRARDLARGKPSSEARSDMFFLEIKNFEEEFTLAQSQAAAGGGASNPQLDELVQAQKDVIVATWKLDRRAKSAGATSAQDIRAVAAAESDLRARVERISSSFRQGVMRDPRARPSGGRGVPPGGQPGGQPGVPPGPPPGGGLQGTPRAGQALGEEDAMGAASAAMGDAVTKLNALKTADAVAPEMEALNQLLHAQADVSKREVQRQQAGQGGGSNRVTQDLSSLFDKELARRQETNYETRNSAADQGEQQATAVDKIKELARRQDELLKKQQDLARQRAQMSTDEVKRALEKLTREQNDLRQRAEEVAQQLAQQSQTAQAQPQQQGQAGQQQGQQAGQQPGQQPGQAGQAGQQGQSQQGQAQGQQSQQPGQQTGRSAARQPGQQGQQGQQGRGGQAGESPSVSGRPSENERRMREISEEMRASASQLRREDTDQASARSERALDKLRDLEQQLQGGSPEGRRRKIGDLQLETRQLADAERQVSAQAQRAGPGEGGREVLRRLAGEQERLADRLRSVQEGLKQQGADGSATGKGTGESRPGGSSASQSRGIEQAASAASREIERQRLGERMQESAQAMRAQGGVPGAQNGGAQSGSVAAAGTPQAQAEIARVLDRLADQLSSADRARDDESRTLTGQLARAQELRERMEDVTRRLGALSQQAGSQPGGQSSGSQPGRSSSQPPPTQGKAAGESGRSGQGQGGSGSSGAQVEELRAEMTRELTALRELVEQSRRDQRPEARGGTGTTFEGQGMTLSAPGTEGFKQDFAKWQELTRQATVALESIEASASKRLQEKESKDRLTAGADDRAPAGYQQQVDSYFKALASRKTP